MKCLIAILLLGRGMQLSPGFDGRSPRPLQAEERQAAVHGKGALGHRRSY